jgi:hypothetical protein
MHDANTKKETDLRNMRIGSHGKIIKNNHPNNYPVISSAAVAKPKIQVTSHALTARGSSLVLCIYRRRVEVFNFEGGRER